jgi:hypothetical protein
MGRSAGTKHTLPTRSDTLRLCEGRVGGEAPTPCSRGRRLCHVPSHAARPGTGRLRRWLGRRAPPPRAPSTAPRAPLLVHPPAEREGMQLMSVRPTAGEMAFERHLELWGGVHPRSTTSPREVADMCWRSLSVTCSVLYLTCSPARVPNRPPLMNPPAAAAPAARAA